MNKNLKNLELVLKYNFKKLDLLHRALIHKSFDNNINNEKLEFLGDRVLGLIISKKLIEIYPNEKEGAIDKKYASLVNKKTCYHLAKKLGIKKFILLGDTHKLLKRSEEKVLSDCMEAIIGAIFLDNGLNSAEKFVFDSWRELLKESTAVPMDSKTKLQEFCLKKYKELPKYTFKKKSGPQHNPMFKTYVEIPNSTKIIGSGSSKKDAQQDAAGKLLKILKLS